MSDTGLHPEDIKAVLRKRHGSVFKFEEKMGLPRKSVSDLLRGRSSKRTSDIVAREIKKAKADLSDDSGSGRQAHRLNAEAR